MRLQHNTVLITGGSSGIGLALAKALIAKNNTVIICGRSEQKLQQAGAVVPGVHTYKCDVSIPEQRLELARWIETYHPSCNILFNNAGIAHKRDFRLDDDVIQKAEEEIQINLIAPIALSKLFLPLLERNRNAAICNITTGLVYAPRVIYLVYNATKAGVHSFTQVLRHQLRNVPVRVIEVMMTVVDTPWHKGSVPKIAITPEKAVSEMMAKIEAGQQEIRIDKVKLLYLLSRLAPGFAFKKINDL